MRWAFACIGLVCAAPALAEQPFAPFPTVVDYVVTMVGDHGKPGEYVRTVMHHGAWTRVDNKSIFYHNTAYFSPAGPIEIHLYPSARANNEVVSAHFVRRDIRSVGWDDEPRNTGERQTLLGETCTVWDVAHSGHLVRSSCITDDGIELWSKVVDGYEILSSVEATRVERRPVAPDDVTPDDVRRAREFLRLDRAAPHRGVRQSQHTGGRRLRSRDAARYKRERSAATLPHDAPPRRMDLCRRNVRRRTPTIDHRKLGRSVQDAVPRGRS